MKMHEQSTNDNSSIKCKELKTSCGHLMPPQVHVRVSPCWHGTDTGTTGQWETVKTIELVTE